MKKPNFYLKIIIGAVIIVTLIIALQIAYFYVFATSLSSWDISTWPAWKAWIWSNIDSETFLILYIPLCALLFMILGIWYEAVYRKENQWYWEHKRNRISSVKVKAVGLNRRPELSDLDFPRDGKQIIRFVADYQGKIGERPIALKSDDPDIDFLLEKIDNPKLLSDKHIIKTKILAVNNNMVTYTGSGLSIGGALIGGIIAGDVGALLGGLTGSTTSQTTNGENVFTFLVEYDDRTPETEKVKESAPRFKFLITKLET